MKIEDAQEKRALEAGRPNKKTMLAMLFENPRRCLLLQVACEMTKGRRSIDRSLMMGWIIQAGLMGIDFDFSWIDKNLDREIKKTRAKAQKLKEQTEAAEAAEAPIEAIVEPAPAPVAAPQMPPPASIPTTPVVSPAPPVLTVKTPKVLEGLI